MDDPNQLTWDPGTGWLPNPRSNALKFDSDLSTQWRKHLMMHGLGHEAVLDGDERYSLVGEILAGDAREKKFMVSHSPDGDTPIKCSHTSVKWPPESIPPAGTEPTPAQRKALRYELSRKFTLVYGEVHAPKPE